MKRRGPGLVLTLALMGLAPGCKSAGWDEQAQTLVPLERGMSEAQVEQAMGRPPDERRPLPGDAEDWIYLVPERRDNLMLHMQDGTLRWVKVLPQPGHRWDAPEDARQ